MVTAFGTPTACPDTERNLRELLTLGTSRHLAASSWMSVSIILLFTHSGRRGGTHVFYAHLTLVLLPACPDFEELLQTLFYELRHPLDGMRERRATTKRMNMELGTANGH